jgi:predicted porin
MQKKIIAAAVAGLLAVPAFAQSNVTISGSVWAGYESYKLSGATVAVARDTEDRVSDQSSRIIFSGTEDLGGGLKAWFQLDNRFGTDLGGFAASGNTGVGLMGGWGKFTIGRWDVHYNEGAASAHNSRAQSLQGITLFGLMSQNNGTAIAMTTRTPNLLMWDSANMGGFTARVAYSTNIAGNEGGGVGSSASSGGAYTVAARYANGPWNGGLSYWSNNSEGPGDAGNQRSTRAHIGYGSAAGLKVGLVWDSNKLHDGAVYNKRSAWQLPISYFMGAHGIHFSYARAGNSGGVADTGATQWHLGYDYALSKRTNVGVYYTKLTNKTAGTYDMFALGANGATATNAGEDARQIYFGMSHAF